MFGGDPDRGRSAGGRGGVEIGAHGSTHRLDRTRLAAILQQVPSEAYDLSMQRIDPVTGSPSWARGVIGDADGHEVLASIDGGRFCLRLDAVDDLADHLGVSLPTGPLDVDADRPVRHGLLLVSPRTTVRLVPARGDGSLHILQGEARGPTGLDIATLSWRAGEAVTLTTGDTTLVAVTIETALPHRTAGPAALLAPLRRLSAMVLRRPSDAADPQSGRLARRPDFRLVRSRHAIPSPP